VRVTDDVWSASEMGKRRSTLVAPIINPRHRHNKEGLITWVPAEHDLVAAAILEMGVNWL